MQTSTRFAFIPATFLVALLLSLPSFCAVAKSPHGSMEEAPGHISQGDSSAKLPPLSGITLFPNKKSGTFTLVFAHMLEEPATIRVINGAKKVLFTNSMLPDTARVESRYELGKLPNGHYLVEVKTSNTTYWTKLKVRR